MSWSRLGTQPGPENVLSDKPSNMSETWSISCAHNYIQIMDRRTRPHGVLFLVTPPGMKCKASSF